MARPPRGRSWRALSRASGCGAVAPLLQATQHGADRFSGRRRSSRCRVRREHGAAGRQRHGLHKVRIQFERKMAGAPQARANNCLGSLLELRPLSLLGEERWLSYLNAGMRGDDRPCKPFDRHGPNLGEARALQTGRPRVRAFGVRGRSASGTHCGVARCCGTLAISCEPERP